VLKRILWLIVTFPAAILLVTLAVANRHDVQLVLDPTNPANPVLSVSMPFYFYLLLALVAGVILGGIATWMAQGRWRQTARRRTQDAARWQADAERLARERDDAVNAAGQSPGVAGNRSSALLLR
jgi:uncharacterized integral membrane protein